MVFTPRTRGVLNPESRCSPSGRKSLSRSRPEPKKVSESPLDLLSSFSELEGSKESLGEGPGIPGW